VNDYGKDVRRRLIAAGCYPIRMGRGDHEIWRCPRGSTPITVPIKIPIRHTANGILKQAGLPKAY
jgi:hypothetical protein